MVVADYKDRANRAAKDKDQIERFERSNKEQIKQFEHAKMNSTMKSADQLAQWANKLQFVKVTTKLAAKDAAMTAVYNLPAVKAVTSATIQAYGKNFFNFIGDEKNLAGIAQRGMEAYLKKSPMMPKIERQKVGILPSNVQSVLSISTKEQAEIGWEAL